MYQHAVFTGITTRGTDRDKLLSESVYKAQAIPVLVLYVSDIVGGISILYPANASSACDSYVLLR